MIETFMISCGFISLLLLGGFIVSGHPEIAILVAFVFIAIYFGKIIRQNKEAYLAKMFVICLALALLPFYMEHIVIPFTTAIIPVGEDYPDLVKITQIFIYLIDIIGVGIILYFGYLFIKSLSHKKKINLAKILSENGFIPGI